MKIIYGKDSCILQGASMTTEVVITYLGSPFLSHKHLEIIDILNQNQAKVRNGRSTSVIIHGNNQIHIGFLNGLQDTELFKYSGQFRIISAKVNNRNIPIEVFGVDYPNLINSKPENMGKPENYKGNYKFGRVPQKKTLKGIKNKTLKQLPSRSY